MIEEPDDAVIRCIRMALRIYMIIITMVLLIYGVSMWLDGHVIIGSMILAGTLSGVIQISILLMIWIVFIQNG